MIMEPTLTGKYLSCFSIAVLKHHDQENLQKEAFNWAYGFRGLESLMVEQMRGLGNQEAPGTWGSEWMHVVDRSPLMLVSDSGK